MDIVRKKLVTGSEGAVSIPSGGLNLAQILKVARAGIQMDYTDILNLTTMNAREWTYLTWSKRLVFKSDTPFFAGEKIYIMYKITL